MLASACWFARYSEALWLERKPGSTGLPALHAAESLAAQNGQIQTLLALLDRKVIPIINENDVVATDEIRIGDNDNLSALVANLVDADGTAPVDRLVRLLESAVPAATTLGPDASRGVKVG